MASWLKTGRSNPKRFGLLGGTCAGFPGFLVSQPYLEENRKGGGGKNGEKGGPGGRSVDGCLFWFLCSSQICVPPYSFLKEGF